VLRGSRPLLLMVVALLSLPACLAQSKPQHARDYIYSQDGRLILTAEPSAYPPDSPPSFSASAGECASDGVSMDWSAPTDVGPGLASYTVYQNGSSIGTFNVSVTWATDYNVTGGTQYTYSVVATDRAGVSSDPSYASVYVPLCICDSVAPGFTRKVRNSIVARLNRLRDPSYHTFFAVSAAKLVRLDPPQLDLSLFGSHTELRWPATHFSAGFALTDRHSEVRLAAPTRARLVWPGVTSSSLVMDSTGGGR